MSDVKLRTIYMVTRRNNTANDKTDIHALHTKI